MPAVQKAAKLEFKLQDERRKFLASKEESKESSGLQVDSHDARASEPDPNGCSSRSPDTALKASFLTLVK